MFARSCLVVGALVSLLVFQHAARAEIIDFEDAPLSSYRSYTLHGVRFSTVFCLDRNMNGEFDRYGGCFVDGMDGGEFNPGTYIAFKDAGFTPAGSHGALTVATAEGLYPAFLVEFPTPVRLIGVDVGGYPRDLVHEEIIVMTFDETHHILDYGAAHQPPPPATMAELRFPESFRPTTTALIFANDLVRFPSGEYVYVGNDRYMDNLSFEPVPEPAGAVLAAAGFVTMACLAIYIRRR